MIRADIHTHTTFSPDVRSGIETGNVEAVLDGDLDEFVIGYHRWRVSQ